MRQQPDLPQPGDVVADKYRIEGAIGTGGMGAVFEATDTRTGRSVALKWLKPRLAIDPLAAKRFLREARASARIHHPNVVDIYGLEEHGDRIFLVFERLQGETLRELLRRERLGAKECLDLLLPAMRGAVAAHAQGVVHRDIKPENVFLARDPDDPDKRIPKLLDFGISKLAADSPEAEGTLTATGAMLGTPHYMSLEQLQGSVIDARADVYAVGVVLYECLTGKRPFDGESFSAIVVKAATETPVDPRQLCPELSRELADVVLKAIARERDARYPSMQALIEALVALEDAPPQAPALSTTVEHDDPGGPNESVLTQTSAMRDEAMQNEAMRGEPASNASTDTPPAPLQTARPGRRLMLGAAALLVSVGAAIWLASLRTPSSAAEPTEDPLATAGAAPPVIESPAARVEQSPQSTSTDTSTDTASASTGKPNAQAPEPVSPGSDAPPSTRSSSRLFESGWVYLGNHANDRWTTRYFDGWSEGLPARGAKITARGRSYVRNAMPDAIGVLATPQTTIGPEQPVKVIDLARWMGGSYVWARVEPAW